MASSINEQQVLWSSASSVSLSTNSRVDSDAISLNIEDWDGALQVSADNSGTPASGDTVDVYVKWTTGDVLGDSSDDYDTDEHSESVCRLDTFSTNTPGEDPARMTVPLNISGKKGLKVSVVAAQGASRAITFRARLVTHRPQ
jgi:hypothetical protein